MSHYPIKRYIVMLLLLLTCVALCACSTEEPEEPQETTPAYMQEILSANIDDTVTFGMYEQDNDEENGREQIEWIVADKDDGAVLLISKYCIDAKDYHDSEEGVTWKGSAIRQWLNNGFIEKAFDEEEQTFLYEVKNKNEDNPKYGTIGGGDSLDKVFLLSYDEAYNYFPTDSSRVAQFTPYAQEAAYWSNLDPNTDPSIAMWYLRTPGRFDFLTLFVEQRGNIDVDGTFNADNCCDVFVSGWSKGRIVHLGIRPALWVALPTEPAE